MKVLCHTCGQQTRSKKPFHNFDPQVLPEENKDLTDYGPEGFENLLSHYGSNETNLWKLTCQFADPNPIAVPNMKNIIFDNFENQNGYILNTPPFRKVC